MGRSAQRKGLPRREIQEYYKGEDPEVMVKYAKQMMHTSVIETINQGVVPSGREMGLIGNYPRSWCEKQGGGGYSAMVEPVEGSEMCTSYGGSTVAFKRRLPDEHFNKEEPELYLQRGTAPSRCRRGYTV